MKYRDENGFCLACGAMGVDKYHIKTRGAGGCDSDFNLLYTCRKHHSEVPQIGLLAFSLKYPKVKRFLSKHGWYFDSELNTWMRK